MGVYPTCKAGEYECEECGWAFLVTEGKPVCPTCEIASLRAELEAARACIRDALHLTPVVPDEDHWSWRHLEVVKAAREGK